MIYTVSHSWESNLKWLNLSASNTIFKPFEGGDWNLYVDGFREFSASAKLNKNWKCVKLLEFEE